MRSSKRETEYLRKIADYYPDKDAFLMAMCGGSGDTLAKFIVEELHTIWNRSISDGENAVIAIGCMNLAIKDISSVISGLESISGKVE